MHAHAMASCKTRRENTRAAPETPTPWTLPADLVLEIAARSEPGTLFRFAAACKLLCREILCPSFIRRVSHQPAPCILAYLYTYVAKPLILVHPSTTVAASFCQDRLWRFMSCKARSLLGKYQPVASRRGLVLLHRWNIKNRSKSNSCSDLCVYNPMSGAHTFLSCPPDIKPNNIFGHEYVLLTAADGIGCSFMLLVADFYGRSIRVQTASSCGTWGPARYVKDDKFFWYLVKRDCDPSVLRGGVIHWLTFHDNEILSYNLVTGKPGSVKAPPTTIKVYQLHLATSSDGELLKLLGIGGFMISVWLQLPMSAGGGGWTLQAMIDMEEKFRLMDPDFPPGNPDVPIVFEGHGKRTGDVVLLRIVRPRSFGVIVLDLNMKDMHKQERDGQLLEIDLPSHLENMKVFS